MRQSIESARGPAFSAALHCAAIALMFLLGLNPAVRRAVSPDSREVTTIYVPRGQGGGGGGKESRLPASRGALPPIARRQFALPTVVLPQDAPLLPMAPAITISSDLNLPQLDVAVFGDPFGKNGPPSDGRGRGGGIGDGDGTGIGPGKGPGVGPGDDGGFGGGGHAPGGIITAPVVLYKVEPEFSEDARKAKLQGTVILYGEVDTNGQLRNIRVVESLGLGLDEKAIEAVKQWRFRPGTRNGKPVVSAAAIEVNFHLL